MDRLYLVEMGKYEVSVTDERGRNIVYQIFGELNSRFLENPNPSHNKTYFKAVKQILEQVEPENVEVDV